MNRRGDVRETLEELRRKRASVLYPMQIYGDVTPRDLGQLRMLAIKVGSSSETKDLIIYVLNNWAAFGREVKSLLSLSYHPPVPRVGFLFAHSDVALKLMRQSIAEQEQRRERKRRA
jgi:hypothetical protein